MLDETVFVFFRFVVRAYVGQIIPGMARQYVVLECVKWIFYIAAVLHSWTGSWHTRKTGNVSREKGYFITVWVACYFLTNKTECDLLSRASRSLSKVAWPSCINVRYEELLNCSNDIPIKKKWKFIFIYERNFNNKIIRSLIDRSINFPPRLILPTS